MFILFNQFYSVTKILFPSVMADVEVEKADVDASNEEMSHKDDGEDPGEAEE